MKQFIALIASVDDFGLGLDEGEDISDAMIDAFLEKESWLSSYEFEVPNALSEEAITRIARGIFWENNWIQADTVSVVMEDHGDVETLQNERQEAREVDPQEGIEDEDSDELMVTAIIR
jgi:hypothetical protein